MAVQNETKKMKKINFFKKIYYSITKFEKYPVMSAEGTARAFKYLCLLMLIFSVIVSAGWMIEFQKTIKTGVDYIQNELPDFKLVNGKLEIAATEKIKIDAKIPTLDQIIIDTNTDSEEQIDEYIKSIPTDNTGIIFLKDKLLVKVDETNQRVEYRYEDILSRLNINKGTITKLNIIEYLTGNESISFYIICFSFMTIYVLIIYLISVLVDTLLIAVLGMITALFTKLKLKFSAVYNMSVYALTLSILLNAIYIAVNFITGFEMSYFQIMYTSIAYVYLVAAIFIIRLDFEKKQAELMKIIEEQEKVHKELNEQKQEENEDAKPEEKDEVDGKKEEKEKSKDEPTGSEA